MFVPKTNQLELVLNLPNQEFDQVNISVKFWVSVPIAVNPSCYIISTACAFWDLGEHSWEKVIYFVDKNFESDVSQAAI